MQPKHAIDGVQSAGLMSFECATVTAKSGGFSRGAECGLSRKYFTNLFKATIGVTPHRWLQQYRIQKAKDLLRTSSHPIADIAIECGFADQSHLMRVFAALTGGSPAASLKST